MYKNILNICKIGLLAGIVFSTLSCRKEKETETPITTDTTTTSVQKFHLAYAVNPTGQSATYFQEVDDLSTGTISFKNLGFLLPSSRTARPYASNNGQYVYSLDYGGGQIYAYKSNGGVNYNLTDQKNIQFTMGTTNPRWTKVEAEYALMHNVSSSTETNQFDGDNKFIKREVTCRLLRIGLDATTGSMPLHENEEFEVVLSDEEAANGVYISRIDAPAVANGKAYYGFARSKISLADYETRDTYTYTDAQTLVVDYPSLKNPTIISTDKAAGATNGYRTPCMHVDENGDVYQVVSSNGDNDLKILRITASGYDGGYELNISELLGKKAGSNGWFYVGNGIGYIPYFDAELGDAKTSNWYVARIDLYNNKAVTLKLPEGLWLQQYQYSKLQDGKFVMAIQPTGQDGNIYFLDPTSDAADAFEKRANLKDVGADECFIGIF